MQTPDRTNNMLRTTRIRKGLTQSKLAESAGVSRQTIYAAEQGADLRLSVAKRVANVLQSTVDELFSHSPR
ncbi:helix-turn-helix domain-containing protein [Corynebacterium sp. LaCa117]|nr:helix-turn-helix domain-containing protein [Corynebacterium tuberculostearicum]WKE54337.1 helix-turn-helix domain-containing protein [Corynebacterium tuberculostearicum]